MRDEVLEVEFREALREIGMKDEVLEDGLRDTLLEIIDGILSEEDWEPVEVPEDEDLPF